MMKVLKAFISDNYELQATGKENVQVAEATMTKLARWVIVTGIRAEKTNCQLSVAFERAPDWRRRFEETKKRLADCRKRQRYTEKAP